ncbi:MAG TPA: hypothetical protein VGR73_02215 [Bryobacteraceae bacterium]|nr:hypothetical protein [Bryobacteraceae bacterium]
MHKTFVLLSLWTSLFTGAVSAQVFITGQAARAVIGQSTFTSQTFGGTVSTSTTTGVPASDTVFGAIGGVAYGGNTLFATDDNRLGLLPQNNRVLVFNNLGQLFPAASAEIPPLTARCPLCGGRANVILGQPDIATVTALNPPTAASLRLPLGIASDGHILAIADTANNRILLWKSLPSVTGQAADLVLGQPDFVSFNSSGASSSTVRGPQGVWIQNGKLFVADTGNNRILIWNSIPSANNQPADVVLGQPDFNSGAQYNLVNLTLTAAASIMASPTSVTSDGTHLFVSDLGFSRVLIWNFIPTLNQQPADVEIGQTDMTQSTANDTSHLCKSNGTDTSGNPTYPSVCAATLNFPRFALSDGTRLYVADGGNDRVLVYNQIPTTNAARADAILGQPDEFSDVVTSNGSVLQSGAPLVQSAANVTPTPTSLAWDGANLYVADPTDYRILVFSPATPNVPLTGVVNSASQGIFAQGTVTIGGTITAKNTVTVTIGTTGATKPPAYTYTVLSTDTLDSVAQGIVAAINASNSTAGDPNVLVYDRTGLGIIVLVARIPGPDGDNITVTATVSTSATITATANGGNLGGGGSAGQVAPGTLISINAATGFTLADATVAAPNALTSAHLPWELGGVEVYFDGDRAPVFMVSPTQINAQVPWELAASSSASLTLRIAHADGSVTVTNAIGVPVIPGSPGIYANPGPEPRAAMAFHGSNFASGSLSLTFGAIQAGDAGTINIGDRNYTYTVKATDTMSGVRDAFIDLINADHEAVFSASAGQIGFTVLVTARVPGPLGNGIPISSTTTTATANFSSKMAITANTKLTCCANLVNAPVTQSNPALPGEMIFVVATGIGLVCTPANSSNGNCTEPDPAKDALISGAAYAGPAVNVPLATVAAADGGAATTLAAGVVPGTIGLYQVVIQLPDTLTRDPFQQLTLSQNFTTSNIVTIPVGDPLKF